MMISKNLFLAARFMVACNRGYRAGIADGLGSLDLNGTGIDGTVISYRGTDNPSFGADPIQGASDIVEGWFAGRTRRAVEFHTSVTGASPLTPPIPGLIFTGHLIAPTLRLAA